MYINWRLKSVSNWWRYKVYHAHNILTPTNNSLLLRLHSNLVQNVAFWWWIVLKRLCRYVGSSLIFVTTLQICRWAVQTAPKLNLIGKANLLKIKGGGRPFRRVPGFCWLSGEKIARPMQLAIPTFQLRIDIFTFTHSGIQFSACVGSNFTACRSQCWWSITGDPNSD